MSEAIKRPLGSEVKLGESEKRERRRERN